MLPESRRNIIFKSLFLTTLSRCVPPSSLIPLCDLCAVAAAAFMVVSQSKSKRLGIELEEK